MTRDEIRDEIEMAVINGNPDDAQRAVWVALASRDTAIMRLRDRIDEFGGYHDDIP